MSTIHSGWLFGQPQVVPVLADEMLGASGYWKPDSVAKWVDIDVGVTVAKAVLNTVSKVEEAPVAELPELGLVVTANARLDNRAELLIELSLSTEIGNAELIGYCYERWAKDAPSKLRGDFVFIIWDVEQQQFFCARDQLGVKSLFYSVAPNRILISNEHNALFAPAGGLKKTLNRGWLINSLWALGPNKPASPCATVHLLPPGCSVLLGQGNVVEKRYWHLQKLQHWDGFSDEQYLAVFREKFIKAVADRCNTEFPLGCELSEGLDSNGIAGAAVCFGGVKKLHTFSYGCERLDDSNRTVWGETYADIQAMLAMHPQLSPVWVDELPNAEALDSCTQSFYQAVGCCWPTKAGHFWRAKLASEAGCRVLLSGWGGDHGISAPGKQYESELLRQGHWVRLVRMLRATHERGTGALPSLAILRLFAINIAGPFYNRWAMYRKGATGALYKASQTHFLNRKVVSVARLVPRLEAFMARYRCFSVADYHRRELESIGVDNRLLEAELEGRMFRVEYRYPALDVDLLEYAFNLPSHLKIHHGIERYAFRHILDGLTTEKNRWRVKANVSHPKKELTAIRSRQAEIISETEVLWKRHGGVGILGEVVDDKALTRFFKKPALAQAAGLYALWQFLKFADFMPPEAKE